MQKEILDALAEEAKRLDDLYYQLGDVLDVKASIILVLATFLGTVSGQVLSVPNLSAPIKLLQFLSVISLGLALIFTVLALRIRKFDVPPDPERWSENLALWEKHYENYDRASHWLLLHFEDYRGKLISERITENKKLAAEKSRLNKRALQAVTLALTLEFASLLLLALGAYGINLRTLFHF